MYLVFSSNTKYYLYFRETWEKKNLHFHDNGTVSFNQEKIFKFEPSLSVSSDEDVVVVPNIPMLVSAKKKKRKRNYKSDIP